MKRRAFTVIELLVVIAIIALLIAIFSGFRREKNKDNYVEPKVESSSPEVITGLSGRGALYTVTHDGHMFVVYSDRGGYSGAGGLVHHPDCGCGHD